MIVGLNGEQVLLIFFSLISVLNNLRTALSSTKCLNAENNNNNQTQRTKKKRDKKYMYRKVFGFFFRNRYSLHTKGEEKWQLQHREIIKRIFFLSEMRKLSR